MSKDEFRTETGRGQNTTICAQRAQFDPRQAIENARILYPDLSSVQRVELVLKEAIEDLEYLTQLARKDLLRVDRAESRKLAQSKEEDQFRLPGFELLPMRIRGERGREVNLLNATFRDVERYVKHLGAEYDNRKANDPKIKQAKVLLDKMWAASQRNRGVTVGVVLGLVAPRGDV